jgi:probable DNA metabolism protein
MLFLYDGTYDGLLTAIFESYRLTMPPAGIVPEAEFAGELFEPPLVVVTDPALAGRVRQGVLRRTAPPTLELLYRAFHSEANGIEMLIYRFIDLAIRSHADITENFADATVHELHRLDRQVGREVHRMHAFVRFQRTLDDLYYAVIDPDFNVLPLIGEHFAKRYAAQRWVIYDSRRHYGIYYDLQEIQYVTFDVEDHRRLEQLPKESLEYEEEKYRALWKDYFKSINIPERRNMKLHLQHVPKRYWKYLVEKQ